MAQEAPASAGELFARAMAEASDTLAGRVGGAPDEEQKKEETPVVPSGKRVFAVEFL